MERFDRGRFSFNSLIGDNFKYIIILVVLNSISRGRRCFIRIYMFLNVSRKMNIDVTPITFSPFPKSQKFTTDRMEKDARVKE